MPARSRAKEERAEAPGDKPALPMLPLVRSLSCMLARPGGALPLSGNFCLSPSLGCSGVSAEGLSPIQHVEDGASLLPEGGEDMEEGRAQVLPDPRLER